MNHRRVGRRYPAEATKRDAMACDVHLLAAELQNLREMLLNEARTPGQAISAAEVAQAQVEAAEGHAGRAIAHLERAGSWPLQIAERGHLGEAIRVMQAVVAV